MVSSLAKSNCYSCLPNHVDFRGRKCFEIDKFRTGTYQVVPVKLGLIDPSCEFGARKVTRFAKTDSQFAYCDLGARDRHY